jgi:hypothetical protein
MSDDKILEFNDERPEKKLRSPAQPSEGVYDVKMELSVFMDGSRVVPKINVVKAKKYIPWRDADSSLAMEYPIKLLELYNNSSLHHSIIDMKAEQIHGGGLELVDTGDTKAEATLEFLAKINQDGDDCNDVNYKMALDYELFKSKAMEMIFTKDWSKIDYVRHKEIAKLRVETPDDEGNQYGVWWAFDWSMFRPTKTYYYEKYNAFKLEQKQTSFKEIEKRVSVNNENQDVQKYLAMLSEGNTMIYYDKAYSPNSHYYSIPDYIACATALEADILSDQYCASSLKNGMDIGMFITIRGEATNPDDVKSGRLLLKNYSGARMANKPAIYFSPAPETDPKVQEIGNGNSQAQKYRALNEQLQQKILSGHRIPNSSLVGISTAGKLGLTNEYAQAQELFFTNYIRPRQVLLEKMWNVIMKLNGLAEVRIKQTNRFNESAIETAKAEKQGINVVDETTQNPETITS